MKEMNHLGKMGRVKAPPGFEAACLEVLSERKKRHHKEKYLRLSLAGAFSAVLVAALVVGVFVLPQRSPVDLSSLEGGVTSDLMSGSSMRSFWIIPITESVGYVQEMRDFSREAPTIYILEQVFDQTDTQIKY